MARFDTTRDMLVASLRQIGAPVPRQRSAAERAVDDNAVPALIGLLNRTAEPTKRAKLSTALDHLAAARRLIREATR